MISEEQIPRIGNGAYPETIRALAVKWGKIFHVPTSWIVSHAWVESKNRPKAMNPNGPAWGVMQMKLPTAKDTAAALASYVRKCKKGYSSMSTQTCSQDALGLISRLLKQWHGNGEDLFNPELAMMFSVYYLSVLIEKLGEYGTDQKLVAASYNQGRGAVMKAIKAGKLTPPMKHYLAAIEQAKEEGFS